MDDPIHVGAAAGDGLMAGSPVDRGFQRDWQGGEGGVRRHDGMGVLWPGLRGYPVIGFVRSKRFYRVSARSVS